MHAAYSPEDISSELVLDILGHMETTAVHMAESSHWSLTSQAKVSVVNRRGPTVKLLDDLGHATDVDQDLIARISAISSDFLCIDSSLVKAETSLLSLGLDSIKSVGLSRKLSMQGLGLSSADIMKLSTPLRLATLIQRSRAPKPDETRVSDASFKAECGKLTEALDLETIKLSENDSVKVYPTTVLQAGMLSQVIYVEHVCFRVLT